MKRERRRVLVVSSHMDDEVLGLGGTIAKHVRARDQVVVCIVTKRAYEHQFDPSLVERERACCRRAGAALGVRDLRFLDLRDELLDERLLDTIVPLDELVASVKPQIVYTHHRGDLNQDHRAVFHATMIACRTIAAWKVPRILCYEVPSSTEQAPPFPEWAFLPNTYVDISRTLKTKLKAMRAYQAELREFPHPRSLGGIEALARKRGTESGFHAAEAFLLVRDLRS